MAAILGSLCGATVGVVVKPVYDIFFKHATYPFTTDRNIRDLAIARQALAGHKNDVQDQIELGIRDCRKATSEANTWLEKVDNAISNGESHEQIKNAVRALRDVENCISSKPKNVTVQPASPSVQEMPLSSTEQQPSRAAYLQQAIQYIKDDPAGVIGIWGLGGVGKTYLLTQINNSFIGDSFFDSVIFVTASKEASTKNIQAKIVKKLGLREDNDVESQATIIFNFLNTRNFLISLDDVWSQVDLQAVGIPTPHGSANRPRRKVVLTTRSKEVCGLMEVRKYINLACLPPDEAWNLFQCKVGHETLSSTPCIQGLAQELVKELKGLPLALITVGRAMHLKTGQVEWELAIDYMKKSCCDDDDPLHMEDGVLRRLKFSYDSLRNDTLRQCFLTCSLWPEDWEITIDNLVQCWMGIGLVDECDIHSSYTKAYTLIRELKAACLLESCENKYLWKWFQVRDVRPHQAAGSLAVSVKMHDVVRDMAIWISCDCGKNNDKWVVHAGGADSFKKIIPSRNMECVSLIQSRITDPFGPNHSLTRLRTLYLQGNCLNERTIGAIRNFTELTFLDLSRNQLKDIPEELFALTKLEYLNLSYNYQITEVSVRLGELTKLKYLLLGGTCINYMPTEIISILRELKVLDLIPHYNSRSPSNTIKIIEVLGTLTNLKAVDIIVASDIEYEILCKEAKFPIRDLIIDNLREVPVFCLSGIIFSSDILRRTLCELNIEHSQMEQIILGDALGRPFDALSVLVLITLPDLKEVMWNGISPQALFPKLTHLRLYECDKLQHISWAMYLPCLEYLHVSCCRDMEQAFLSTEDCGVNFYRGEQSSRASIGMFPCLKQVEFRECRKLTSLCDSNVTFPSLQSLKLWKCLKLKTLSFNMESLPPNFQKLVMDSDSAWNALEWEGEEVKASLRRFLTIDRI
ncbi:hypothetical protein ACP4OV_023838 [Aristida adscensionis]